MSRTRRRTPMRRKKRRADWVYRTHYGESVTHGGYQPATSVTVARNLVAPATINSQALILLDSQAFMEVLMADSFSFAVGMPAASRPELPKRPKVDLVEGDLMVRYLQWTTGAQYQWGWRLGWFEQDTITGLLSLQAEYSMFEPNLAGTDLPQDVANFANDNMGNCREQFTFKRFVTDGSDFATIRFKARIGKRAPTTKHCLALYLELSTLSTTGTSLQLFPALRSLIEGPFD